VSWFQVLKDDETPKKEEEEELPSFREEVMNTPRWLRSRRNRIFEAILDDDGLNEFMEDPEIIELVEKKDTYFIRDIEFVKRLIAEDTIDSSGKVFQSLKGKPGVMGKETRMLQRLNRLGQAKKTSSTNQRKSTEERFKQLIDGKEWKELFELLKKNINKTRFKAFISTDSKYRKRLIDTTSGTDYEAFTQRILFDGEENFDSYDYTGKIGDDQVKKYVNHILTQVKASVTKKNELIDLSNSRGKSSSMRLIFHSSSGMHPALEFILDNKSFNTSAMVKGGRVKSVAVDNYLIDRLSTGKPSRVPIPEKLKNAYALNPTGADRASALRLLQAAKKKGDKEFLTQLKFLYPDEVREYQQGFLDLQREKSGDTDSLKELLEDIEDESLGAVRDAMGVKITREELKEQKEMLIEVVNRLIDGSADDSDKEKFPQAVKESKEKHPFNSSDFTQSNIMSSKLGLKATPANIVNMLSMVSDLVNGSFTDEEIYDYFDDMEKIEEGSPERFDRMDKFLDEIRKDYESIRRDFIDRIADNMKLILSEGTKLNVSFARVTGDSISVIETLEPYLFIKKILRIRD